MPGGRDNLQLYCDLCQIAGIAGNENFPESANDFLDLPEAIRQAPIR
jgi:hypothetical protein